ncbi:MAG: sugar kinase [Planctomycetes bacterium]|nr:sugar kinase [Planctomycetota bacterium]
MLICVGTIAFDTIETPEACAEDVLGGSATHFGFAASLLGPVGLVGVVGDDFPDAHLAAFRARGIDTAGVQRVPGRTFRWAGRYLDDMNVRETTDLQLNVFADFDPQLPDAYRDAGYCFLANGAPAIQQRVLDQLRSPRLVVADTMNHWIETARDEVLALLRRVDGVMVNDEEARMLSGRGNLVAAARGVARLGPRFVVVKKGAHGSMLVAGDDLFLLPAFPVEEVRDPTGAGDCFAGAFMGFLAWAGRTTRRTLCRALFAATVIASFNVEAFGVERLRTLGSAEVFKRGKRFIKMIAM